MNWDTMLGVVMSMVFFAPLLIALVAFLVVGLLVAFEGVAAMASKGSASLAVAGVSTATQGPIVSGLNEAIAQSGAAKQEQGGRAKNG